MIEAVQDNLDDLAEVVYADARTRNISMDLRVHVKSVRSAIDWLERALDGRNEADKLHAFCILFRNTILTTTMLEGCHFLMSPEDNTAIGNLFNESFVLTQSIQGMWDPDTFYRALMEVIRDPIDPSLAELLEE